MANILPFQGIRYNPKRVRNLSKVVSPPYDVITEAQQEHYYRASPYNVIRLELGKRFSRDNGLKNRYIRARLFFKKWSSDGVLIQDKEPSIYIYEQTFKKGKRFARRLGFMALLELGGSGGKNSIYPHEKTFPSPKEDRFLLLKSLQANISPLFFLFSDRRKRIEKIMKEGIRHTPLMADVSHGSEQHRVWRLTDPSFIKRLRNVLSRDPLFIADGHHRYEVALAFRKKMKAKQGNCVMAYFSNLLDTQLTILPIHRLVKGLEGDFESLKEKLSTLFTLKSFSTVSGLLKAMEKTRETHVFGMYWKGKSFTLLTLSDRKALFEIDASIRRSKTWRRLDVTILHELVFKKRLGLSERSLRQNVLYNRDLKQCIESIRKGDYQVGFFLRAARIHQIQRIALSKERVPQKSTYFYPKPLTGLVMYRFDDGVR